MKKDSGDYFTLRFGSNNAHLLVKYSSLDIAQGTHKISQDKISHEIKIIMGFNVANLMRCENKVLM